MAERQHAVTTYAATVLSGSRISRTLKPSSNLKINFWKATKNSFCAEVHMPGMTPCITPAKL